MPIHVIVSLLSPSPLSSSSYSTYRHWSSTNTQSTHGIIVDMYSHPFPPHSPHPGPQLRNWHIQERKSRVISVISQLGIVGRKYLVDYGRDWMWTRWMKRRIRVGLSTSHLLVHVTWLIPEFELVTQALWTDPGDQSGWIYHRWLIGTSTILAIISCEANNQTHLIKS